MMHVWIPVFDQPCPLILFSHGLGDNALLWQFYSPQLNTLIALLSHDVYKITIDGIIHETFSDLALQSDPEIGKWLIDEETAQEIIHSYVGAFFNYYLKNIPSLLLEQINSPWKNVKIEKRITNRFQNTEHDF